MIRIFLLFSTLAMSVLFLFFNRGGQVGFLFSDIVLKWDTWLYFFFEHFILVILAVVILGLEPVYKISAAVFLSIQIIDTVDYCLTYGEPWWNFPVTWNHIKVFVFGTVMTSEFVWKRFR